jgi:hypothetical protein
MSNFLRAAAVAILLSAAGCAIHPLPEDVTGLRTHEIVQKIRCEARGAVRDNLVRWLKTLDDPAMQRLAADNESGARPVNTLNDRLFRGSVRDIVRKFENSAIAYNFTFDMTELNNFDPTIDFIKTLTNGSKTLGISAGLDRSRENIRTFTITDTFLHLLTDIKEGYCSQLVGGKNYLYPVTGNIGIDEMIRTFVELALFDNLSTDPTKSGPPTLSDQIMFTTLISGSVTPKIVLMPVTAAWQLADASFTATATRKDVHTVTVGLALEPPPAVTAAAATHRLRGFLVNAKSTTGAEYLAVHAVEQTILRFQLGRPSGTVILPTP